nr:MAG TPA: hypothetical protein [Caudoviricetes sp.]
MPLKRVCYKRYRRSKNTYKHHTSIRNCVSASNYCG